MGLDFMEESYDYVWIDFSPTFLTFAFPQYIYLVYP